MRRFFLALAPLALVLHASAAFAAAPTQAPHPPAPAPAAATPPPNAGARLDTGVYTVEGQNLTWNQRTGEFTIPKDVKFTQPGTDVTGDQAAGNSLQKKVTITGHVVLHNSKPVSSVGITTHAASAEPQTLTTDKLAIDGPAKIYTADGNVKFTQGTKTVTAAHGQLNQTSHLLELSGNVHIDDASSGQSMIAENVTYDTANETVTATGKPFQIRAPVQSEAPAPATAAPSPKKKKR
ncbi:MAG: LPS export ABC transporter periplasmic protein LptC [Candidatus Eremiobacteraeota bacterium]|nr:LPS export ABC transporter periplasmic protein LptC [Candidatus Eremiobacteraeota bacterium]